MPLEPSILWWTISVSVVLHGPLRQSLLLWNHNLTWSFQQESFFTDLLIFWILNFVVRIIVCFILYLFVCEVLRNLEVKVFHGCQKFPQCFLQDVIFYLSTYTYICRFKQINLSFPGFYVAIYATQKYLHFKNI